MTTVIALYALTIGTGAAMLRWELRMRRIERWQREETERHD